MLRKHSAADKDELQQMLNYNFPRYQTEYNVKDLSCLYCCTHKAIAVPVWFAE